MFLFLFSGECQTQWSSGLILCSKPFWPLLLYVVSVSNLGLLYARQWPYTLSVAPSEEKNYHINKRLYRGNRKSSDLDTKKQSDESFEELIVMWSSMAYDRDWNSVLDCHITPTPYTQIRIANGFKDPYCPQSIKSKDSLGQNFKWVIWGHKQQ